MMTVRGVIITVVEKCFCNGSSGDFSDLYNANSDCGCSGCGAPGDA